MPHHRRAKQGRQRKRTNLQIPAIPQPLFLLASSLNEAENNPQFNSQLYQLPRERMRKLAQKYFLGELGVRDKIYTDVITAERIPYVYTDDDPFEHGESRLDHPIVYTALLRTCRAIYAETYILPVALNPAYGVPARGRGFPGTIDLSQFADPPTAWQFASISSLVLHADQYSLEEIDLDTPGIVEEYAALCLLAPERHSGLSVAAKYAPVLEDGIRENNNSKLRERLDLRHDFHYSYPRRDLDEYPIMRYLTRVKGDKRSHISTCILDVQVPCPVVDDSAALYYSAAPITHLTIRMDRASWAVESDPPAFTLTTQVPGGSLATGSDFDKSNGLALDPGLSTHRPTVEEMLQATENRRARLDRGDPPLLYPLGTWGRELALFPDLRKFTLHLETFAERAAQLDCIADCAKLWNFPLGSAGGAYKDVDSNVVADIGRENNGPVLNWDGKTIAYRWGKEYLDTSQEYRDNHDAVKPSGFEVRILTFC